MNSIVTAKFDSMDEAKLAVQNIQSQVSLLNVSLDQVTPADPSFSFLAPPYPFGDADRAEQTHGNWIPPIVTAPTKYNGKTRVKMTLNARDTGAVQSYLHKAHGHSITIQTKRD